ncbi:hypothetical protein ACIOJG_37510 [Streptomyces anulatus]
MIDMSKQDAVEAAARAIATGDEDLSEVDRAIALGATHNDIARAVMRLSGIR